MPLRSPSQILSLLAVAALGACASACSKTDSPVVPGAPTIPSAALVSSGHPAFEVVTVTRPESIDAFLKVYRQMYKTCAFTREVKKLPPPPPMLVPPADYISERKTYISDGKAYLVKEEYFTYQVNFEEPSISCETSLEKTSNTTLMRDGKAYIADIDATGRRNSEPPEEWAAPGDEGKEKIYTLLKSVKGYAVKCMPPLPNSEKLLTELCIADMKPGTLGIGGEPIIVSSRVTSAEPVLGPVLTEPVSIKVGGKIDTTAFDAAAAP